MWNRLNVAQQRQQVIRLRRVLTNPARFKGDERRFVGNVSFDRDMFGRKVILARHIRFRNLFYYIQARGITCCLHVASDDLKARATLITLGGRGICATFRRRGQSRPTTGEGAFNELLMVLKETDCSFNLSLLNPATAYGMAAMLYGNSTIKSMKNPRRTFLLAVEDLKKSGAAGCVQVLNENDEMIVTAYVHNGEARSFVSSKGGYLESCQSAGRYLGQENDVRCVSYRIDQGDLGKLQEYSFAVTNLKLVDESAVPAPISFSSTEEFLTPFFKKPNLMDTLMFDNVSLKEKQESDIDFANSACMKRACESFSHKINPFWGRM